MLRCFTRILHKHHLAVSDLLELNGSAWDDTMQADVRRLERRDKSSHGRLRSASTTVSASIPAVATAVAASTPAVVSAAIPAAAAAAAIPAASLAVEVVVAAAAVEKDTDVEDNDGGEEMEEDTAAENESVYNETKDTVGNDGDEMVEAAVTTENNNEAIGNNETKDAVGNDADEMVEAADTTENNNEAIGNNETEDEEGSEDIADNDDDDTTENNNEAEDDNEATDNEYEVREAPRVAVALNWDGLAIGAGVNALHDWIDAEDYYAISVGGDDDECDRYEDIDPEKVLLGFVQCLQRPSCICNHTVR